MKIVIEEKNRSYEGVVLCNVGNAYAALGDVHKAIRILEQALDIFREIGEKNGEARALSNLGDRFTEIGEFNKGFECNKDAYQIDSDLMFTYGIGCDLYSMAKPLVDLGKINDALFYAKQGIEIAQKTQNPYIGSLNSSTLALAYLLTDRIQEAHDAIEIADSYNEPQFHHYVHTLHGIIALRQGDEITARGAFVRAIEQADEILSKTAEYYSALDAKGFAICGLALCARDDGERRMDGGQSSMIYRQQAIETFKKARKIAPHAGVVKSVLRLFDELVKCDSEGILKEVRKAVEGF